MPVSSLPQAHWEQLRVDAADLRACIAAAEEFQAAAIALRAQETALAERVERLRVTIATDLNAAGDAVTADTAPQESSALLVAHSALGEALHALQPQLSQAVGQPGLLALPSHADLRRPAAYVEQALAALEAVNAADEPAESPPPAA